MRAGYVMVTIEAVANIILSIYFIRYAGKFRKLARETTAAHERAMKSYSIASAAVANAKKYEQFWKSKYANDDTDKENN
jgi:hypothetical protein